MERFSRPIAMESDSLLDMSFDDFLAHASIPSRPTPNTQSTSPNPSRTSLSQVSAAEAFDLSREHDPFPEKEPVQRQALEPAIRSNGFSVEPSLPQTDEPEPRVAPADLQPNSTSAGECEVGIDAMKHKLYKSKPLIKPRSSRPPYKP
ncbi:hypothetical protein H0H81_007867 [Sphagnurus paluster]|uniref:Uncharacterized protein n=1 Tax=Sphagnurus paluster TaxID=117069 RepID=A0A9P7KGM1_9AGAR|nr:hypothetical protein H0H81_007867 [Sphagnurus paluster]